MSEKLHRSPAIWWSIVLCAAVAIGCGDDDSTGPAQRRVEYTELLGEWRLELRDTAACAGLTAPVAVTLTINQRSEDAFPSTLLLDGARSHWSAPGRAGYLTGSMPLSLPSPLTLNLVLGAPPPPEAPPTDRVAQFFGTLTADLELEGVLYDPYMDADPAVPPIFSAQRCGYQLRGGHT